VADRVLDSLTYRRISTVVNGDVWYAKPVTVQEITHDDLGIMAAIDPRKIGRYFECGENFSAVAVAEKAADLALPLIQEVDGMARGRVAVKELLDVFVRSANVLTSYSLCFSRLALVLLLPS
jgi:hypothetical protein